MGKLLSPGAAFCGGNLKDKGVKAWGGALGEYNGALFSIAGTELVIIGIGVGRPGINSLLALACAS